MSTEALFWHIMAVVVVGVAGAGLFALGLEWVRNKKGWK